MKVLIIGKNGQVATYLRRALSDEFSLVVMGRDQLDLAEPAGVADKLAEVAPSLIINAAAYTAVDRAEQERDAAFAINRDSVAKIAQFCAQTGTLLIHYSTDYVFSGDASVPYLESDQTGPTGVYGLSKLEGEQAILSVNAPAIILRTSWVYSNHGKNFYKTMLSLAKDRNELSVVADQIGSPTYAGSIAAATKSLIHTLTVPGGFHQELAGVYHFTCQGQTSWCEFAKALFEQNGFDEISVNPIPSCEYPTPAQRPAFSVLNGGKLRLKFDVELPHWKDALRQCAMETNQLA